MGYYDFEYFWTHQELGGKELKVLENQRQLSIIRTIRRFIFYPENSHCRDILESTTTVNNSVAKNSSK